MNAQTIMKKSKDELLAVLTPYLIGAGLAGEKFIVDNRDYLSACIGLMHERMKTLTDFVENGLYYFQDPAEYDEKAVRKIWGKEGVVDRLKALIKTLETVDPWEIGPMETAVRTLAEQLEVGLGKILQPARLAVTGSAASPGMFELMEVLRRETTLRRLRAAISFLQNLK